jgi:hypothetical protein
LNKKGTLTILNIHKKVNTYLPIPYVVLPKANGLKNIDLQLYLTGLSRSENQTVSISRDRQQHDSLALAVQY